MQQSKAPLAKGQLSASTAAALLAIALIWGYNWVQMKVAVQYAPPFLFAALRNAIGAATMGVILLAMRRPLWPKAMGGTAIAGMLQTGCMYGLVTWALVSGGAGKTAVLAYTMPFWVLLLAGLLLGERIRGLQWVAIALGLAGLLLILEPHTAQGGDGFSKIIAGLAGLIWGVGVIVAKRIQTAHPTDLITFTTWQLIFGALLLGGVALTMPLGPVVWSWPFVGALLYSSIPGTAIAWLLWLYVLGRVPAGLAALGSLLNPAFGVLFAGLQLGERPSGLELGGMGLIGGALLLIAIATQRR